MLHAKFQDHIFLVLEKNIFKVFTIYGPGNHLGHVTWTIYINFRSPFPGTLDDDNNNNDDDDGSMDLL